MRYWHSTPRLGRRPLIRMNREWPAGSGDSISINNSPAANRSSLREATIFALNVSVTLRLLFKQAPPGVLGIRFTSRQELLCRFPPPWPDLCGESPAPSISRAGWLAPPSRKPAPGQALCWKDRSGKPDTSGGPSGESHRGIRCLTLPDLPSQLYQWTEATKACRAKGLLCCHRA